MDQSDWIAIGLFFIGQIIAFLYWASKQHNALRKDMGTQVSQLYQRVREVETESRDQLNHHAESVKDDLGNKASKQDFEIVLKSLDDTRAVLIDILRNNGR